MTNLAPSSSIVTNAWRYHVFLSFRGMDTRFGFTNNLYQALVRKGIRSFIDHEDLQVGEEISPTLTKAVEESRIGIIIFSENYASSTFCLEELVEILKCMKGKGRLVWPIFYKVKPCNVRCQLKSYKDAFDKLEIRFGNNSDKIEKWKKVLYNAANLKGEHFNGNEYESNFIGRIVQKVSKIINRTPLLISVNCPVGLETRVQNVISLLDGESSEAKCMVGIWGIGGIGKSTIARILFNLMADQFEGLCFLADVRENSISDRRLVKLQKKLLSEILEGETIEFIDVHRGSGIIKDRLQQKKVLLVLDDIDQKDQLQGLAGGLDWFGPGSKIIITTRDKHLLGVHGVERIYEVKGLNDVEACELFCWNAFKKNKVDSCYMNISKRAIRHCHGLPLALDIIGCNLFDKTVEECESALDVYERYPIKDIQKSLKISYDGLEDHEKIIFLDIACFFSGYLLRDVKDVLLKGRGFDPTHAISVLVDKSLISITGNNIDICHRESFVSIHDLIQDMGREIVRQESKLNPGERSRLWFYRDILDVLQGKKGTDKIEFIMLDLPEDKKVDWDGKTFKVMKGLKVLIIKNARFSEAPKHLPNSLRVLEWPDYPSSSLPQSFHPSELVRLKLVNSQLTLLRPLQKFEDLTDINLSNNRFLKQIPDIFGLPNLRRLNITNCVNLITVHDSIGDLDRIQELHAAGCCNLLNFPHSMKSRYLRRLDMSGCSTVPNFPKIVANDLRVCLEDIPGYEFTFDDPGGWRRIFCRSSLFTKLDKLISESSEWPLKIIYLKVNKCPWIDEVFSTCIAWFPTLEGLSLKDNKLTDEFLLLRIPWFPNLTNLDLSRNNFTILPACINECCCLRTLKLDGCYRLVVISGIPSSVKYLSAMNCTSLSSASLSLLSSEELHKDEGTYFTLPGSRIPNWFHYSCRGSSLSFWFRNKFPRVALCLVFLRDVDYWKSNSISMRVNGQKTGYIPFGNRLNKFVLHVNLFDLKDRFQLWLLDKTVEEYINDGWNHIEFEIRDQEVEKVEWMGVYVYKQNHESEVRFTSPTIGGVKRRREFHDSVHSLAHNHGPNPFKVYARRNKSSKLQSSEDDIDEARTYLFYSCSQ